MLVIHDLTEMRRLETVRRDFVANVSHELKTPLTSISGYAETLLTDRPDRETTRQFLGTHSRNARRMQELVDDLLDLSRIESGRWQPRSHRAGRRSSGARGMGGARRSRGARSPRNSTIKLAPDARSICADLDAFRQILTNLSTIHSATSHPADTSRA